MSTNVRLVGGSDGNPKLSYIETPDGDAPEIYLWQFLQIGSLPALQHAGRLQEACTDGKILGGLLVYSLMTDFTTLALKIAKNPATDMLARATPISLLGRQDATMRSRPQITPIQALAWMNTHEAENRLLMMALRWIDRNIMRVKEEPSDTQRFLAVAEEIFNRTPRTIPGIGSSAHYTDALAIAEERGNRTFIAVYKSRNNPSCALIR